MWRKTMRILTVIINLNRNIMLRGNQNISNCSTKKTIYISAITQVECMEGNNNI